MSGEGEEDVHLLFNLYSHIWGSERYRRVCLAQVRMVRTPPVPDAILPPRFPPGRPLWPDSSTGLHLDPSAPLLSKLTRNHLPCLLSSSVALRLNSTSNPQALCSRAGWPSNGLGRRTSRMNRCEYVWTHMSMSIHC